MPPTLNKPESLAGQTERELIPAKNHAETRNTRKQAANLGIRKRRRVRRAVAVDRPTMEWNNDDDGTDGGPLAKNRMPIPRIGVGIPGQSEIAVVAADGGEEEEEAKEEATMSLSRAEAHSPRRPNPPSSHTKPKPKPKPTILPSSVFKLGRPQKPKKEKQTRTPDSRVVGTRIKRGEKNRGNRRERWETKRKGGRKKQELRLRRTPLSGDAGERAPEKG